MANCFMCGKAIPEEQEVAVPPTTSGGNTFIFCSTCAPAGSKPVKPTPAMPAPPPSAKVASPPLAKADPPTPTKTTPPTPTAQQPMPGTTARRPLTVHNESEDGNLPVAVVVGCIAGLIGGLI